MDSAAIEAVEKVLHQDLLRWLPLLLSGIWRLHLGRDGHYLSRIS